MKRYYAVALVSAVGLVVLMSPALYGYLIDPWLKSHDEAVEKTGFDRGVAYAGRKCWYRGYFMDGDQRYDCTAGKEGK